MSTERSAIAVPDAPSEAPRKAAPAANPVRRPALIVVAIALVLFLYGLIADRSTPYTSQATVQAYVVKIAPEVAGKVIELGVGDNARVAAGDVLLRIDPEPYRLAVERAEAQLETAGQSVGSSTAGVAAAEASLATAIAERQNVREQSARVLELVRKGVYAAARADQRKGCPRNRPRQRYRGRRPSSSRLARASARRAPRMPRSAMRWRPWGVRSSI